MWYLGAALAFLAGYLYPVAKAEALALGAAALAAAYLGMHLSARKKAEKYRRMAEEAQARAASLHVEAEEARRAGELHEQQLRELKNELIRLREQLPADEEQEERLERIIADAGEEL